MTRARPLCYTRRTMNHLKTLLLWLLLAALPLQGYAAVSMFMCHAGPTMPATITAAPHQHAAGKAHHRAATAAQKSPDGRCAMHAGSGQSPCKTDAGNTKCSSCAACCVGLAITVPVSALASVRPLGSEAIPYRVMHVTAHVPGGLERPPHPLPA